jgi:hypothetical protein
VTHEQDLRYLQIILEKIQVCRKYQPKFGQGQNTSLQEFENLYRNDAFYHWFGLDNPMMYAAHKAAGGITSLYRQIGIACEAVFQQILMDQLSLTYDQVTWSYSIEGLATKARTLSLDGRIQLSDIQNESLKTHIQNWLLLASQSMKIDPQIAQALRGMVFEVRQGYKSKDSKRQNADVAHASMAYQQGYLPIVVLLSMQIDGDVAIRYRQAGWLLLYGSTHDMPLQSTFAFCKQVLGYDLATFFQSYAPQIQKEVAEVLVLLLSPN